MRSVVAITSGTGTVSRLSGARRAEHAAGAQSYRSAAEVRVLSLFTLCRAKTEQRLHTRAQSPGWWRGAGLARQRARRGWMGAGSQPTTEHSTEQSDRRICDERSEERQHDHLPLGWRHEGEAARSAAPLDARSRQARGQGDEPLEHDDRPGPHAGQRDDDQRRPRRLRARSEHRPGDRTGRRDGGRRALERASHGRRSRGAGRAPQRRSRDDRVHPGARSRVDGPVGHGDPREAGRGAAPAERHDRGGDRARRCRERGRVVVQPRRDERACPHVHDPCR